MLGIIRAGHIESEVREFKVIEVMRSILTGGNPS
jgi:hypothetical protein